MRSEELSALDQELGTAVSVAAFLDANVLYSGDPPQRSHVSGQCGIVFRALWCAMP